MNSRIWAILLCTAVMAVVVTITLIKVRAIIPTTMPITSSSTMKIESSAFAEGQTIPKKYTCDGPEVSPALSINGVPKNAKSLTLFLEDPDTSMGTFTHWAVFNISPEMTSVAEELPKTSPTFGTEGKNSAGTVEYLGPCPPTGTHHYIFTLYALDTKLTLPEGSTKEEIIKAMEGHILAEAKLTGLYGRK